MAAHRYWRIYSRNSGGTSFEIGEIEMRTSVGGADQCAGGTAIGTAPTFGALANAFANDGATTWVRIPTADSYIGYDFGAGNDKDIVEIGLQSSGTASRMSTDFTVDYSDDGVTWTTAWRVFPGAFTAGVMRSFAKPTIVGGSARYWRLCYVGNQAAAQTTGPVVGTKEMEMRETVGGADVTGTGTAFASSNTTGNTPNLAFDNNNGNEWTAGTVAGTYGTGWIGYDFGTGNDKAIVELVVGARSNSQNWGSMIKNGSVEASPDGINWVQQWAFTNQPGGDQYFTRIIKPGSRPAAPTDGRHRFWGIRLTALQDPLQIGYIRDIHFASVAAGASYTNGPAANVLANKPPPSVGTFPSNAFVINASGWESGTVGGVGDWVAYDFGIGTEVLPPVQIRLQAGGSGDEVQMPTNFDLIYSDDGETWLTQESFVTPGTWAASETRSFAVTSVAAGHNGKQILLGN